MKEVLEKLRKLQAKRIFVHFPEGLRLRIQDIVKNLEKEGFEVVICMEATYGACDVREYEAKLLGCNAILHIAHEDYGVKCELPVVYWEYFFEADAIPILEKEFSKLEKYEKIGLVTSVQFAKEIPKVKKFLEKKGKKVFVAKILQYLGQILGCRIGAGTVIERKVDAYLCIAPGKFYGLGLALKTEKPLLNLDLEKGKIYDINELKKRVQKITAWNKALFKDAKKVGLLISWKKGQMFGDPFKIKKKLEEEGKEVYLLAFDEIKSDRLEGLKLDIVLNFACPRLGTDDLERFKIPMLNFNQL